MVKFPLNTRIATDDAKGIARRERVVFNKLKEHGYSDTTFASIMANMKNEMSSFDPYSTKGGAYGMFQLKGDKLKGYREYVNEYDLEDSVGSQIDYFVDTIENDYKGMLNDPKDPHKTYAGLGHSRNLRRVFNDGNISNKTKFITDKWLKPFDKKTTDKEKSKEYAERFKDAHEYHGLFKTFN
jgi:hypothetical protein